MKRFPVHVHVHAHINDLPTRIASYWKMFATEPARVEAGYAKWMLDFIIIVCDNAAGEVCPIWPGHPMTAHWASRIRQLTTGMTKTTIGRSPRYFGRSAAGSASSWPCRSPSSIDKRSSTSWMRSG